MINTVNIAHVSYLLKCILLNESENQVLVKLLSENNINWTFIIPTIISLVSLGIVFWDRMKKSLVIGKIVSYTFSPHITFKSGDITLNGQGYFLKLSLQVLKKNFYFKDIKIIVKYPNDKQKYAGRIYWANTINLTLPDGLNYDLNIPFNDFLLYNNVLMQDTVLAKYITFIVDSDKKEQIESMEIIFITLNDNEKIIKPTKLSTETMLFGNNIWHIKNDHTNNV